MFQFIEHLKEYFTHRLKTKQAKRLWRRVREHCAAIRVIFREMPSEWRGVFGNFPTRMKTIESELYKRVLSADQILRHVPKDNLLESIILQIKIGIHRGLGNHKLAYAYECSLENVNLQKQRRVELLAAAQKIENEVIDYTLQLQRWSDHMVSIGRVSMTCGSDHRAADVLEQMQQEMEDIQTAIRAAQNEMHV